MTPERYQRVSDLFLEARRRPETDREAWLRAAAADDPSLAGEVRVMLGFDSDAPGWSGPLAGAEVKAAGLTEPKPEQIARYRILEVIGEGGMGVVFKAEQESPRRIVALKVIRPGLLTRAALRRFEHEAQILGRLKHPGIAQILEAGSAAGPDGGNRPFLAMEFVQGVRLTAFASARALTIRGIIDLFIRVCEAVHHAHQRGVIHRDLKPANILVEESGQPKVVDFGIARATEGPGATVQTLTGQLVGTLQYMSPEQIGGHPEDLDTRSDVYALGVVLYELLVGKPPYDLSRATILEAGRIIREHEPEPPGRTRRELAGDVQAILGKALEKDRARRYQSAAALAEDLRRFLNRETVTARPQTTLYQLRRFAARNRGLVGAAAAVALTLLGGIVVSSTMYWQAESARSSLAVEQKATERERDRALAAETLATTRLGEADRARADAERHAARAGRVKSFLVEMFGALSPAKGNRPDLTVREMVDAAAERLPMQLTEDPEVRAEAMSAIGVVYAGLGMDAEARRLLTGACDLFRQTTGPESLDYAAVLVQLARLPWRTPALTREARARCDEAVAIYRKTLGDQHEKTIEALGIRMMIGQQGSQGTDSWNTLVDAALPLTLAFLKDSSFPPEIAEVTAEVRRLYLAGDMPAVRAHLLQYRQSVTDRIERMWATGDHEGASEELRRHYLPIAQVPFLQGQIPRALTAMGDIVETQDQALGVAEALYREAVVFGREHPGARGETYRHAVMALAFFLRKQGQTDESESLYREALHLFRETSGPESEFTAVALMNLALLRHGAGDDRAAEPFARECVEVRRAVLKPGHVHTLESLSLLGEVLQGIGDHAGAEAAFRECLDWRTRTLDASNWRVAEAESLLGGCLLAAGKRDEAGPLLRRGYEGLRSGAPSPVIAERARLRLAAFEGEPKPP